jgi:glycerophosphoryl diester phosphodiesterase
MCRLTVRHVRDVRHVGNVRAGLVRTVLRVLLAIALVAAVVVLPSGVAGTTHVASAATVNRLIGDGADVIITDYPNRLLEAMDEPRALPAMDQAPERARPMPRAHAHNDYEHGWPLLDALSHGFTSVEADVWLVDGELMVAHDRRDVVPGRSLERLYLSPLEVRRKVNGGTVYPGWDGSFQLLIDVKSEAGPTYAAIDEVLREHPELMTTFTGDRTDRRAVTAVISGNRDRAAMLASPTRYAGYDGRLSDLNSQAPASFMPLVSDDWTEAFTWDGTGEMPAAEEQKLRDVVTTAHDHGYRVRFWATPDEPGPARDAIWRKLLDVGVDEINTDDLAGLQGFLSN